VAMVPPLWFKLMDPKVKEWDLKYASPEELKLSEAANKRAGWGLKASA
jgi:toluene methyl-monooxygenase